LSFLLFIITKILSGDLDIRPTNKQTICVHKTLNKNEIANISCLDILEHVKR